MQNVRHAPHPLQAANFPHGQSLQSPEYLTQRPHTSARSIQHRQVSSLPGHASLPPKKFQGRFPSLYLLPDIHKPASTTKAPPHGTPNGDSFWQSQSYRPDDSRQKSLLRCHTCCHLPKDKNLSFHTFVSSAPSPKGFLPPADEDYLCRQFLSHQMHRDLPS